MREQSAVMSDLPLFESSNKRLQVREQRVKNGPSLAAKMIAILAVAKRWVNRTELKDLHGMSDRECRLGRENAHGRIIAGPDGYKLMRCATPEEIRVSLALRKAQIDTATRRYIQEMNRAHRALHERGET